MAGVLLPCEGSCTGVEAPYVPKKAPYDCGSSIVAGDEGGPVLVSVGIEDVSDLTTSVTKVVGHELGKDAKTGTDRVLLEPPKNGTHDHLTPEGENGKKCIVDE